MIVLGAGGVLDPGFAGEIPSLGSSGIKISNYSSSVTGTSNR